jgi:hypothetical protein
MNGLITLVSVLIGGCLTLAGGWLTNHAENKRQHRKELQDIYISCIRNLVLVLTLARIEDDPERMDKIETSLAESKAFLVLLLAYEKDFPKSEREHLEREIKFFILGQHENVVKAAEMNGLRPQKRLVKYQEDQYLLASDIILQRIVKVLSADKKRKLPKN